MFNILTDDFLLNIAAGNDGQPLTYQEYDTQSKKLDYTFPAWIRTQNSTNVMLVASLQEDCKTLRDTSNWSNQYVDIAAPGTNIPVVESLSLDIKEVSGTTYATAIVSGTANLMLACNNRLSGAEIKAIMLKTADVVDELKDKVIGGKVLNIQKAVKAVCETDDNFSFDLLNEITTVGDVNQNAEAREDLQVFFTLLLLVLRLQLFLDYFYAVLEKKCR